MFSFVMSQDETIKVPDNAHWTKHCFTEHVDPEELMSDIEKSKIRTDLKGKIKTLVQILHCNERIIHYRTSVNYFLEKLTDECPNCNCYSYRIPSAEPKDGSADFYSFQLTCERCKKHSIQMILPYKLLVSYCHFYQITPPNLGERFTDNF